jgi:hypothetical protein
VLEEADAYEEADVYEEVDATEEQSSTEECPFKGEGGGRLGASSPMK